MGSCVRFEREEHILWFAHRLILFRATRRLKRLLVTVGFTPLLAKDSNNHDPARVINISSIAAFSPIADHSKLAGKGNGLWSCQSDFLTLFSRVLNLCQTTLAKQRVSSLPHRRDYRDFSWLSYFPVNHLTSQLAVTLGPKFITYVI
jgi:hypothetical protein